MPVTGDVFITELGPGLGAEVNVNGIVPRSIPPSFIPVVASTNGVGGSRFETTLQLQQSVLVPDLRHDGPPARFRRRFFD